MPTPQEMQAQTDTWSKQYDQDQAAKRSQETAPEVEQHPLTALTNWVSNLPERVTTSMLDTVTAAAGSPWGQAAERVGRDVVAGGVTGATAVVDTAHSALVGAAKNIKLYPGDPGPPADSQDPTGRIWEHAKNTIQDFTDAVKVKDPNMVDDLTQFAAQIGPWYAVAGRALNSLHGVAQSLTAGAAADATALKPQDMRLADTLKLLRNTDGAIGKTLQAAGPYGVNAYINYLAHTGDETEAQAHFKNALDGLLPNFIGTELIHAAGVTVKQGTAGVRMLINNGVTSHADLAALAPQRPPLVQGADPAETLLNDQVRRDADRAAAIRGTSADVTGGMTRRAGEDPAQELIDKKAKDDTLAAVSTEKVGLEQDEGLKRQRELAQNSDGTYSTNGSVHNYVTDLAKHIDGSTEEGAFYKNLFQKLSDKKLSTQFVPPGTGEHPPLDEASTKYYGHHDSKANTTALYPAGYKDNATYAHTVAHEGVHAATMKALAAQPDTRYAIRDLIDRAETSYQVAELKAQDKYGIQDQDPREFVAEAEANPRFQQMLKEVNAADGRPLWDHYKEIIGGIFGLSGAVIASPMFDKVLTRKQEKST